MDRAIYDEYFSNFDKYYNESGGQYYLMLGHVYHWADWYDISSYDRWCIENSVGFTWRFKDNRYKYSVDRHGFVKYHWYSFQWYVCKLEDPFELEGC